jgi:hypothetical protein
MSERTPLRIEMLTREAALQLAHVAGPDHGILYLPTAGDGTKLAAKSPRGTIQRQKHIDFVAKPQDLDMSLESFSSSIIVPCMKTLWKALKEDKIAYTHTLVIPNGLPSSGQNYDGFRVRGIMEQKLPEGMLPRYDGEEKDKLIRFDVLYSRASDA